MAGRSQLPLVPPRHIFLGVKLVLKRKLSDLYMVGKEVTFDDGQGDPLTIYIRKMNPVDQETAFRRANAARARALSATRDPETDDAQSFLAQAMDVGGKDELIAFLNASKIVGIRSAKEAEVADEEEWKKDDYLQGLYDAWNDGLDRVHAADDSEDLQFAEAQRVFTEMSRFTAAVEELVSYEDDRLTSALASESLTSLQEQVAEELATLNGDTMWVREYRRCEIWLCTRNNSSRGERYFANREEVDELPSQVYNRLIEEIRNLTVEPIEGKDLPLADSSLPLSASREPEVTTPSSGPAVVVP